MKTLPTPQQLRYLDALAEHRHFGRAASACAVSQSTLSAGILALERLLDADLLDREAGKHVVFTRLGEDLVVRARAALLALEAVSDTAEAARAPMSGTLRMGVIPTVGPFLLPGLMPVLRARYPRLRLYLREDNTDRLLAGLESGRLDLLLLALPYGCGNATLVTLMRDEFFVALPPGHPLARLDRIPAAALETEPLLLLEEGHCLRDQALTACGRLRERADAFAATSLYTLAQMVAGGLGITLLPRIAVDAGITAGTDIELRPLDGVGGWRSIALAWRANSPRQADFRALAQTLSQSQAPALGVET